MPTLCKRYTRTSNVSLVRIFSKLDLYWFYVNASNSLTHSYLSCTMVLGLACLDLSSLHSACELEIKYSVSAFCKCFLRSYFMSPSTRTWWRMLEILVLNGLNSRAFHLWVRRCIKSILYFGTNDTKQEIKMVSTTYNFDNP